MNSQNDLPVIALTMGDPAGVGPEIIAKALTHRELRAMARFLVIADRAVMERAVAVTGAGLESVPVGADPAVGADLAVGADPSALYLWDLGNVDQQTFAYGRLSAECGRAAFESIETAIRLALDGQVAATVTAPINKEALQLAGIRHAGHTEIFADRTGTRDYAMMLAHDSFRVVHVSTHVSMRDACDAVTKERVGRVIRLAHDAVRALGIESPRIAVAGLNPHAGENGLFGREELDQIGPAVDSAAAHGMDVRGPFPPDTLFPRAAAGEFDCVVAMYHDQGHLPVKMLGFAYDHVAGSFTDVRGVNITLGLPIIRTSVDHGTAFDRAGTGTASETSMVEAIRYAALLAGAKSAGGTGAGRAQEGME